MPMKSLSYYAPRTIFISDQKFEIRRSNLIYTVSVNNVKTIFLKKRKFGLINSVLHFKELLSDYLYDLVIHTNDNKVLRIHITPDERQFLREMISKIRKSKNSAREVSVKKA